MKIIAIINQKGGVGKTTTAINLAVALAEKGSPTLLVDLDPQANATSGLGLTPAPHTSLYPVLTGERIIHEVVIPTAYEKLYLIPSEIDLAGSEIELARLEEPLVCVRNALNPLKEDPQFQHIILDCPPSLGILMTNALAAADALLIPVQCEFYALEGIKKILDLTTRMGGINPQLKILGVLMTMYDIRTRLSQQVLEDVQKNLPDLIFKTVIPRSVRLSEAPSFGQSILTYDPSGVGSTAYRNLAEEFQNRIQKN